MPPSAISQFLDRLRRSAPQGAERTDGQLLEAFVRRRDHQAFEGLVRRHAPIVWGVCRRNLTNHQDAEDAFQAVFLVLVRKAPSIRSRELLANWLYRVARQTALKARQAAAKRGAREKPMEGTSEPKTESYDAEFGPEAQAVLDEELRRLPDKYRIAVLVCDLEGRSRAEAAQHLGMPEGTVASRLARGRELLAKRLLRRGVGEPVAQQATLGSAPAPLLANTIKVAGLFAAGDATAACAISGPVAALTKAVLRATTLAKQKAAGLALLIAALALAGGMAAYHLAVNRPIENAASQADAPVLVVVTTSYPGANAQVVADTVAHNIEEQIRGIKGLVRIESISENVGQYTANLYFKAKTDPESAVKLVQSRVALAEPQLPDFVIQEKVSVTVGKAEACPDQAAIAVIDRADIGWEALQQAANAVVKQLVAEDALTKPEAFPGGEKLLYIDIDLQKCDSLGVTPAEVYKAIEDASPSGAVDLKKEGVFTFGYLSVQSKAAVPAIEVERFRNVPLRDKVFLRDVAVFQAIDGPAAVYRVDGFPAIRITGAPPEGKTVAEAAAQCIRLAKEEMALDESRSSFAVKNLSAK
ncbi:MAG TPA: efflux RND transporter permease subunit [Gemmataceae bacterium]|nr:efflux RND transporter permease subunit [Gemmataceae bacterium]